MSFQMSDTHFFPMPLQQQRTPPQKLRAKVLNTFPLERASLTGENHDVSTGNTTFLSHAGSSFLGLGHYLSDS
jgi:hypothetical protein